MMLRLQGAVSAGCSMSLVTIADYEGLPVLGKASRRALSIATIAACGCGVLMVTLRPFVSVILNAGPVRRVNMSPRRGHQYMPRAHCDRGTSIASTCWKRTCAA